MFTLFLAKNILLQAFSIESTVLIIILLFSSIIALAMAIGLFISLLYVLKRRSIQMQVDENLLHDVTSRAVDSKLGDVIEGRISQLSEKIDIFSKNIDNISKKYNTLESRLNNLEARITILEKRVRREDKLRGLTAVPKYVPEKPTIKELSKLEDIKIYVPQVKYLGLITSQGYIVESYGQCSDQPSKLLEVARISEKFTNSRNISIVRGENRIEIFHLGQVEDLAVYGIIEINKNTDIQVIQSIKESLMRYFNKKFKEVK